jgi:hypothetical protein
MSHVYVIFCIQPYYIFILVIMACISYFFTLVEYQSQVYSTFLNCCSKDKEDLRFFDDEL